MERKLKIYLPQVFQNFNGFFVRDIKEWRAEQRIEIYLERNKEKDQYCHRCEQRLGKYHDNYKLRAKHLKMMGWQVEVIFFREKRHCLNCKKVRSEYIDWLSQTNPHVTMDLAWWLNRLSEVTSVLAVSRLESLDKKACYKVDKYILRRLLQGYKIPKVTHISVDEVYARSRKQQQEGETRDDLFLTVIVDLKTHKVIWVSQSRRKEALDQFFQILGNELCEKIQVVATDQHEGYGHSVREYCKNATQVWDRFHLVQNFNEALNEDRKSELEKQMPRGYSEPLLKGKFRYIYLTKAKNRREKERRHIEDICRVNKKIAIMEMIKEHFHKVFDCDDEEEAEVMLADIYQWSMDAGLQKIWDWVKNIREQKVFYNYFKFKVTTGLSEGMNRVIKGLKWQAYGYKDMAYFALKILQKCGYLNSRFHQSQMPTG